MGIVPTTSDFYLNPNVQVGATNAALFVQKSTGNVGIGTITPNTKLYTKGTLGIERSSSTDYSTIDNEGNLNYNARNSYNHVWQIAGAEKMRLDTNGNVGIGTASPSSLLSLGSGLVAQKLNLYESGNNKFGFGVPGDGALRSYITDSNGIGFTWGTLAA